MHPIAKIASRFVLLAPFILLSVDVTTAADNFETQKAALKIILDFADRLCLTVKQEGTSRDIELSGKAKAELNGLLKRLANLGIEGASQYQSSEYQGVLQEQVAGQLDKSRDCNLKVFYALKDTLLSVDPNKPVPPSRQPSSPPGPVAPPAPRGVSQITKFQLPGQPTLFHEGSNDDQYREAKGILESVAAQHGVKVDRVEVIKWVNLDRTQAKQLPWGLLREVDGRHNSQLRRPSDMSPFDPRRDEFWTEVYDFQVRSRALEQSIIGYWSVGSLGAGNYMLLWAWALLP